MKKGQIKDRVGEKFITNEGYIIEIVEYKGNRNSTVRFEDGTLVENKEYADLRKGNVKNPNRKSVYGVGYFGIGKHSARIAGGGHTKKYNTWSGMIERCYSEKSHINAPSYKDCTVVEHWKNYQNFGDWFDRNYNSKYMQKWALDKDILQKGNKIYSTETCCFVPQELNSLLIKNDINRGELPIGVSKECSKYRATIKLGNKGKQRYLGTFDTIEEAFQAYKTAKESYIKEVADKYKNQIELKVYQALYNYQVEITD